MNVKLPVADNWLTFGEFETVHVCPDGQLVVEEKLVVVSVTVIELPLSEVAPTASIVNDRLVELVALT
ncbi:MAG: hypothetical protein AUJ07_05690 [Crenarchaeota archaeon 13_1_40CM_3_53_5]|nr:MAG: hypothetical protein AUJ07_05690 [Crenarchaeota archaeon 13_1_40CM_3_53_5]